MKMNTSELIATALNWAVHFALHGKCEGYAEHEYSTDWSQGGPVIEREGIALDCERSSGHITGWIACNEVAGDENWDANVCYGPTPLIAAMRCYVTSRLGDEVEIPDELV